MAISQIRYIRCKKNKFQLTFFEEQNRRFQDKNTFSVVTLTKFEKKIFENKTYNFCDFQ